MIRHIVLLRTTDHVDPILEELQIFCTEFEGVVKFEKGQQNSIEPEVMQGYTHGFTIDFVNQEARDNYVFNPEHKEIGARLVAHCAGGLEDVLVFDFEI